MTYKEYIKWETDRQVHDKDGNVICLVENIKDITADNRLEIRGHHINESLDKVDLQDLDRAFVALIKHTEKLREVLNGLGVSKWQG